MVKKKKKTQLTQVQMYNEIWILIVNDLNVELEIQILV